MKIKSMRWALAVLACAGLSGMAVADDEDKKPEPPKERPARPERPQGGEGRGSFFSAMDGNGDGKVTKAEFTEFHMKRIEEMWARMDADKSGDVTEEEARGAMRGRGPGARPEGGPGARPEGGPGARPEGGRGRPAAE